MLFNSKGGFNNSDEDEMTLESQAMIMEAAMQDTLSPEEMNIFLESQTEVNGAIRDEILLERSIVRLDKKAKLSKAQKMAVFSIAKEKKDPKFKKLLTVWKLERFLENYLAKKYATQALTRARKSIMNAGKSKSNIVQKVISNVKKQLNSSPIKK